MSRKAIFIALAISTVLISGAVLRSLEAKIAFWTYRLTVTADTPSGPVQSSSVVSVSIVKKTSYWHYASLPVGNGLTMHPHTHYGEAAVVDLGDGKYIFASLDGDNHGSSLSRAFVAFPGDRPISQALSPPRDEGRATFPTQGVERATKDVSVDLPEASWPEFLVFGDLADPRSVQRIAPADISNVFGQGYDITAVTLAITDEAPRLGAVVAALPWFNDSSVWQGISQETRQVLNGLQAVNCHRQPGFCPAAGR